MKYLYNARLQMNTTDLNDWLENFIARDILCVSVFANGISDDFFFFGKTALNSITHMAKAAGVHHIDIAFTHHEYRCFVLVSEQ